MNYPELKLLIAGEWNTHQDRDTIPVVNPATEQIIGQLPVATDQDLDNALNGLYEATPVWQGMTAFDRYQILRRAGEILRERASEIGFAMTLEQGKPLTDSVSEVVAAADIFDWFAEEGRRIYGRIVPSRVSGVRDMVLRQPVGPVAAFTPWNFPITIPARKIAAALAAGCPVIIKPAEETPATGLAIAEALVEAGLPAGTLSVVFGVPARISEYLIASPVIKKVTFTGSTVVGKHIARLAADGVKRSTLELGGHAPVIVFDDTDPELVAKQAVRSKFRNAGQICIAPTRFLVQEGTYERFVEAFSQEIAGLRVGNGLDEATTMGPLAHSRRVPAVTELIDDAVAQGARLATGGSIIDGPGYFLQPTLLADVEAGVRIMNEEPFGPVALAMPFTDVEAALEIANGLPYGLASYAFTHSRDRAYEVSERIEAGMLAINHFRLIGPETPFGGVKESGYGSEGGVEGIDDFLNTKLVSEA